MTKANILRNRKCDCHVQVHAAEVEWTGEKLEQEKKWFVPKSKGQDCRMAKPEKTGRTRKMLEPDLDKRSVASGNPGLKGKDS